MASARKKQDEQHLKILRELVTLPGNKECFDCHQRGPTYVNMTIGSFVCTSCSGMLRGLTPPHRVKSISMASFSPEEIELIKSRGNEYCARTWLGLYDPPHNQDTKDEQQVKDFMIAKYEKKRYYLDPSTSVNNGFSPPPTQVSSRTSTPTPAAHNNTLPEVKPLSSLVGSKPVVLNIQPPPPHPSSKDNMFTPDKPNSEFLADFGSHADPFSSSTQFNTSSTQASFANFDNNPVFNSTGMPTAATLSNMIANIPNPSCKSASSVSGFHPMIQQQQQLLPQQPPSEDRYAALKDLDSLMKSQASETHLNEWSSVPSNAPTWSVNNNVHTSVFESSQSPFLSSTSPANFNDMTNSVNSTANPFTGGVQNPWAPAPGVQTAPNNMSANVAIPANPFAASRQAQSGFGASPDTNFGWGTVGMNGITNGSVINGGLPGFHPHPVPAGVLPTSQSMNFPAKAWQVPHSVGNPFTLGASPASGHSSNPFL